MYNGDVSSDSLCFRPGKISSVGDKNDILWSNWSVIFGKKKFQKVDREHHVFGCLNDWESKSCGWRIDYIADYYSKIYLIEAKLDSSDALHSGFKIFAYRAAYCIDRKLSNVNQIGVMIFFNSKNFETRMRYICAFAKVEYAVLNCIGEIYELKECSLWR